MSSNEYVNNPKHYTAGSIEAIEYIQDKLEALPLSAYQGMCWGNVVKYMSRMGLKGSALQDAKKAAVYLQWLIERLEADENP